MARPLRSERPGDRDHFLARGNEQRVLYRRERDLHGDRGRDAGLCRGR
jgi:hypothetical protein